MRKLSDKKEIFIASIYRGAYNIYDQLFGRPIFQLFRRKKKKKTNWLTFERHTWQAQREYNDIWVMTIGRSGGSGREGDLRFHPIIYIAGPRSV